MILVEGVFGVDSRELFKVINKCIDDLDFISARRYMEENIDLLKGNKHRLHRNAQDLLEFVLNENTDPLSQSEINIIHTINDYATNFDIGAIKLIVKDRAALINRRDAFSYLNTDAKALLESMHVLTLKG